MKFKLVTLLLLSIYTSLYAQISVQAIGYWDLNETYDYKGTYQKYKVIDKDTVFEADMSYDVTVKVIDSTEIAIQ